MSTCCTVSQALQLDFSGVTIITTSFGQEVPSPTTTPALLLAFTLLISQTTALVLRALMCFAATTPLLADCVAHFLSGRPGRKPELMKSDHGLFDAFVPTIQALTKLIRTRRFPPPTLLTNSPIARQAVRTAQLDQLLGRDVVGAAETA